MVVLACRVSCGFLLPLKQFRLCQKGRDGLRAGGCRALPWSLFFTATPCISAKKEKKEAATGRRRTRDNKGGQTFFFQKKKIKMKKIVGKEAQKRQAPLGMGWALSLGLGASATIGARASASVTAQARAYVA